MTDRPEEREYVEECPVCGTRFIGVTPDDVRAYCRDDEECSSLGALHVFRRKDAHDR